MFDFIQITASSQTQVPSRTLGIEITDPALAQQCDAGNIDGQHWSVPGLRAGVNLDGGAWEGRGGVAEDRWRGSAAIELATFAAEPLLRSRHVVTLAFHRPDLDAVGAAAVMVLRRIGLEYLPAEQRHVVRPGYERHFDGGRIIGDLARRIALVAERDSCRPGGAWVATPLPTEEQPWPEGMATVDATREIAAIAAICSPRGAGAPPPIDRVLVDVPVTSTGDVLLPLAARVFVTACWLLWGEPSDEPGATWGHPRVAEELSAECGVDTGRGSPLSLARIALTMARAAVETSRRALVRAIRTPGALEVREGRRGPVAVIRAAQAGVLSLGYCVAPVVVAIDRANPGKFTVCSWTREALDHAAVRARLNELEEQVGGSPRWGGGAAITGSPQVPGGSRLSEADVLAAVLEA